MRALKDDEMICGVITTKANKEEKRRKEKARNIIIRGSVPTKYDKKLVDDIAGKLKITLEPRSFETKRISEEHAETTKQLLLVSFENEKFRRLFLSKSRKLKDVPEYEHTYIDPDRTKAKPAQLFELRKELRTNIEEEPGNG